MSEFWLIASAHFLALVSPGPDFILLARSALRGGTAAGLAVALGIALANGLWIGLALSSLRWLEQLPWLLQLLHYFGAVLLVLIGWQCLHARPLSLEPTPAGAAKHSVWLGLASGLLNPKNGLFYTGLFALGVAADTSLTQQALYGLWMFSVVLVWDAGLVLSLSRQRRLAQLQRYWQLLERSAGVLLIGLGLGLGLGR